MKLRNMLYGAAIIIFLSGITASIIDKNSAFYLPLLYAVVGLAVIVTIVIVISLIKNKGYIK